MPFWNNKTVIGLILLTSSVGKVFAEEIRIPVLSLPDLSQWESREFNGETRYAILNQDKQAILAAVSNKSASGLFREIKVNLSETPYLHWSWRIENTFANNDEKTRSGDDYPARVYVIISGGLFFWQTQALNYVWTSHEPKGSFWPNAFSKNAIMLSVQAGNEQLNTWVKERRNVLQDIKKYLGKDNIIHVDAVAIMTDSDNTQSSAKAFYGNIYFSNK